MQPLGHVTHWRYNLDSLAAVQPDRHRLAVRKKKRFQFAADLTTTASISKIFDMFHLGNWFTVPVPMSCEAGPVPQLDCQK